MSLASGTKLGPYKVLAPIGAGGMGQVYRARDTRLARDVAVKVLPDELARDPRSLARFSVEARAVAALSHPNILEIHDIGESEGVRFLVTELLDGENLRTAIKRGPLPLMKALDVAAQVARGLSAAHEKGIVHRDLKPENVFLTRGGGVKLLDFGLAHVDAPPSSPDDTRSPTADQLTQTGALVGTYAYMSPEQASGRATDFRSDQFAFGLVLYELLSGQRPFWRPTAPETLAAIIRELPEPLAKVAPETPPPVCWIVERCLAKEPEDRYDSTRDLARDVEACQLHASETVVTAPPLALTATRRRRRRARHLLLAASALLAGAFLFAGGFVMARRLGMRTPRSQRLTFARGSITAARFLPDGRTVVYSAQWGGAPSEVYSVRVEGPESRPLGLTSADVLSASSAGELALCLEAQATRYSFFCPAGTLARVPFSGGTPRKLEPGIQYADFAPQGDEMALVRVNDLGNQLEFPGGTVLHEAAGGYLSHPRVSPSGDRVAFFDHPADKGNGGSVSVVDRGGKKVVLADGFTDLGGLAWSPRGEEVWFSGGREAGKMDVRAVTLEGEERLLLSLLGHAVLHDVARDGRALVAELEARSRVFLRREGEEAERELSWLDWGIATDLTRDGRLVLFYESGQASAGANVCYVRETTGAPAMKLGPCDGGSFSADGRFVLAPRMAERTIVIYPLDPGPTRRVTFPGLALISRSFLLGDGKTLVFWGSEESRGFRVFRGGLEGGKAVPVTPEGVYGPPTPDERHVLGTSEGRRFLYPLAGGEPLPFEGKGLLASDRVVTWADDGGSIVVRTPAGALPFELFRVDLKTGRRELLQRFWPADRTGLISGTQVGLYATPDGRSVVYTAAQWLSTLHLVEGL